MGQPACRLGDLSLVPADKHGCPSCPHTALGPFVLGSPNVFHNGLPATRVSDKGVHAACCNTNLFEAVMGSPTVFINGKKAHRMLDLDQHCGGVGMTILGSPNVFIGGSWLKAFAGFLMSKAISFVTGKLANKLTSKLTAAVGAKLSAALGKATSRIGAAVQGAIVGAVTGAIQGAVQGALSGAVYAMLRGEGLKGILKGMGKGALQGAKNGALEGAKQGALEGWKNYEPPPEELPEPASASARDEESETPPSPDGAEQSDGSTSLGQAEVAEPSSNVLSQEETENRVAQNVSRMRPNIPEENSLAMATFDSDFYGDPGRFNFRGHEMAGWEVNYYYIGMAFANQGKSMEEGSLWIAAWNISQEIPFVPGGGDMTDEMWFAYASGFTDETNRLRLENDTGE